MIITNMTGNANITKVPSNIAIPNNMAAIPRYIGLRLMRKGPEVTSAVGDPYGDTVVLLCKNSELLHRSMTIPKPMIATPKYVYGALMIVMIGKTKFNPTDRISKIIK